MANQPPYWQWKKGTLRGDSDTDWLSSISGWDGKSDVILVVIDQAGETTTKLCSADVLHQALNEYREFLDTHHLVVESKIVAEQVMVSMRFQVNEDTKG